MRKKNKKSKENVSEGISREPKTTLNDLIYVSIKASATFVRNDADCGIRKEFCSHIEPILYGGNLLWYEDSASVIPLLSEFCMRNHFWDAAPSA